jgi:hypothetical protein
MTRPYAPGYRIPTDLLLKAYASGVFPMAESATDPEVFWVRPETRGIIPLDGFLFPKPRQGDPPGPLQDLDADFEGATDGCAKREGRATPDQRADPRGHTGPTGAVIATGRSWRDGWQAALRRVAAPFRREPARARRVEVCLCTYPPANERASRCSTPSSPPSIQALGAIDAAPQIHEKLSGEDAGRSGAVLSRMAGFYFAAPFGWARVCW